MATAKLPYMRILPALVVFMALRVNGAGFTSVSPLSSARDSHTATLLLSGKIIVVGGRNGSNYYAGAERYDPVSNTWTAAGSLSFARAFHSALLLPNGKVLIIGGKNNSGYVASAEVYDPDLNTWSAAGTLHDARESLTATLLSNGKVLIAGGFNNSVLASAELYDPNLNTWSSAGGMSFGRSMHTATLLSNGKVLVAGGSNGSALDGAELYDPVLNMWGSTGSMAAPRSSHTATLLPNGKILVVKGIGAGGAEMNTSELFDPVANTWSGSSTVPSSGHFHTTTLLPNGKVIAAGGSIGTSLNSAEIYDSASNSWTAAGTLGAARYSHTATLLANGVVIIAGGIGSNGSLSSTELYNPTTGGTWSATGNVTYPRDIFTATLLSSGKVLVTGKTVSSLNPSQAAQTELYDPASGVWSSAGSMAIPRGGCTASILIDGRVLVVGGVGQSNTFIAAAELYDPASNLWSSAGSLMRARSVQTETLLTNGTILVAGGFNPTNGYIAITEIYNPILNSWTTAGDLGTKRGNHSATLLPNGKVLVAAGNTSLATSSVTIASAELYDPSTKQWSAAASLVGKRYGHTATLLPNGRVLVVGGRDETGRLATAEIYDPVTDAWSLAGSLAQPRTSHTATLLRSGRVLIAAGQSGPNIAQAELYDPETNTWNAATSLTVARAAHTATLLPNGQVLVASGVAATGNLSPSCELFDEGINFQAAWQPVISGTNSPVFPGNSLAITGGQFKGISEASGGSANSSATNYPLLQLISFANAQTAFLPVDPAILWSDTGFTSLPLDGLPHGYALATVFTSGIPSTSVVVQLAQSPTNASVDNVSGIYRSTVNLRASLSPPIAGKNIDFIVNGALAGSANTDPQGIATISYTLSLNAGNYVVNAAFAGENNLSAALGIGSLTVDKAALTVRATSVTRAYGSQNQAFTANISGFLNGENATSANVTGLPVLSTTAGVTSSVTGSPYIIKCSVGSLSAPNYTFNTMDGELTITKALIIVTANPGTKEYGAANPLFSGVLTGVLNNDNILANYISSATPSSPIGTYPITPSLLDPDNRLGNYTLNLSNGALAVTPAALTVTPTDISRPLGATNPVLTGTITGVQNNDNITAAYSTTALQDSPLGTYSVTATLVDPDNKLGNYTAISNIGTLTIVPAIPPAITSALSATTPEDSPFAYTITSTGDAPITFNAQGLPAGLSLTGSDITGAPTATGVFNVVLTATNAGGSDSKTLKLTVIGSNGNHSPAFAPIPTVSANPAAINVPVAFSGTAQDSDGDALDYSWNFGDGTSASGSTVFKTYAAPGVYIVTLTVTDGQASAFQSINLLVQDQPAPGTFLVEKAKLAFNFAKTGKDSLSLTGKLLLTPGTNPTGKTVRVLIGSIDVDVIVNAKGHLGSAVFGLKVKKGAGSGTFSFSMKNQGLFPKLEVLGFSKTQSGNVTMPVIVVFDGASDLDQPVVQYSVKRNKSGPISGKGKK